MTWHQQRNDEMKTRFYDFVDRVGAALIIAILGIMLVGHIARKLLTGGIL